jgi:hypothetical protein
MKAGRSNNITDWPHSVSCCSVLVKIIVPVLLLRLLFFFLFFLGKKKVKKKRVVLYTVHMDNACAWRRLTSRILTGSELDEDRRPKEAAHSWCACGAILMKHELLGGRGARGRATHLQSQQFAGDLRGGLGSGPR